MWCCSREGHEDVTDEQLGTCSTLGAHDGSGDGAVAWIHRLLGCLWYFEGEMVAGESKRRGKTDKMEWSWIQEEGREEDQGKGERSWSAYAVGWNWLRAKANAEVVK